MERPLIVLADTDENYLATLEYKLLEISEDGTVDFEFISDPGYFLIFFGTPRSAEIVAVDETFYTPELQKHNINSLFVFTKENEQPEREDEKVSYVFKYKSSKEIINELIASIRPILTRQSKDTEITKLISLCAAAGGTGKSSIGIGLAACLAQNFRKVLYINTESIQSFGHYLNDDSGLPSEAYRILREASGSVYKDVKHFIRREGFAYFPPISIVLDSLNLDFSFYTKLIRGAKESREYDVIIADLDSGYALPKMEIMRNSDKVIMVTKQDALSKCKLEYLIRNIDVYKKEKYIFLCNMYDETRENAFVMEQKKEQIALDEYIEYSEKPMDSIQDLLKNRGIQKLSNFFI